MKPASHYHDKAYAFDEYMEPTIVDPVLSGIKPVKSNFVRPSDWMSGEGDEASLEPVEEPTRVESLTETPIAHGPTPWENIVNLTRRAIQRMRENLRT